MSFTRSRTVAAWALALGILAGCATGHGSMLRSADTLERSADAFVGTPRGYFPDAAAFANQARHFRATVADAGDRQVISTYEHLWEHYQALRREVVRSGSRQAQVEFQPVTHAFRHVVRDIRWYADADSAVYARGGFEHDQYYDP